MRAKFLTLLAVVAGLLVLWIVLVRGFRTPSADTSSAAPTVFEAALQRGYPDIVSALLAAGASDTNGQHLDASHIDAAGVVRLAAAQGFKRLDDPTLIAVARLRSDFVRRADPEACAEMWSGGNSNVLIHAIEALPDDQQRNWAELFDTAALATIKNQPVVPAPPQVAFNAAMGRLMATISPADQAAIRTMATSTTGGATTEQKCNAVRLFYGGLEKVSATDALTITRYMQYH